MVFMPPGHAKSTYSSVLFPAWFFAQGENLDIIGASHDSSLAEEFSGKIQTEIRRHPNILDYGLASENVKRWRTTNGGAYRAAGVGGSITGRRADLALIDDPIRGHADAESLTIRDAAWNWYTSELYTRLKPGGRIILIQTRWHEDDLGGRLLAAMERGDPDSDKWVVLCLPAIAGVGDPMGREVGEALWPEMYPLERLRKIFANVGPYVSGALYQQDPKPRGSSFFDVNHLLEPTGLVGLDGQKLYRPVPMPERCDTVFATIDTAIKTGKQHNSTGVIYWAYNSLQESPVRILDWDLIQIAGAQQEDWLVGPVYERLEHLARICGARYGSTGAFIEDKATGTVLIGQMEARGLPVYAIDSKLTAMGKEERAIAAEPFARNGDVKITEPAFDKTCISKDRSANHLISQIVGFRIGSKETDGLDLLDCFTYGISITRGMGSGDRKGV